MIIFGELVISLLLNLYNVKFNVAECCLMNYKLDSRLYTGIWWFILLLDGKIKIKSSTLLNHKYLGYLHLLALFLFLSEFRKSKINIFASRIIGKPTENCPKIDKIKVLSYLCCFSVISQTRK